MTGTGGTGRRWRKAAARRFAARLYADAPRARPRTWGIAWEELARRAEDDPEARSLLLYYAAAVARDRGEHDAADGLLARGADPELPDAAWAHEFELQLAMSEALLQGQAAVARARLRRLPPHASEPAYPLLAEAAVLLAESREEEAARVLQRWKAEAAASRGGWRRWEVGSLWAIELIQERLGTSGESAVPDPPLRPREPAGRTRSAFSGSISIAARWVAVVAVIAGWWSAGSLGDFLLLRGPQFVEAAWFVLALYLAWWVQLFVHEGAHALTAMALGGRLLEIELGALQLSHRGGSWHLSFQRLGTLAGGHVRSALPGGGRRAARRTLVSLCGPAASLMVAVGCGMPLLAGDPPLLVGRLLWAGMVAGAIGALVSVLPGPWGWNDLAVILAAWRGGFWHEPVGERLSLHLWESHRARDWEVSAEEIESAARAHDEKTGWGLLLAAARALDGGDSTIASRLLKEVAMAEGVDRQVRMESRLQLAMIAALLEHDPAGARVWMAEAARAGAMEYGRLAEAALALAEQRPEDARRALTGWVAFIDAQRHPDHTRLGNHWALDVVIRRLG